MAFAADLTGRQFFYLTVIDRNPINTSEGKPRWNCICVCGSSTTVAAGNLNTGAIKSCGCWRKERLSTVKKTHGESRTPEYNTWASMKKRCYTETDPHYTNYGARSILNQMKKRDKK